MASVSSSSSSVSGRGLIMRCARPTSSVAWSARLHKSPSIISTTLHHLDVINVHSHQPFQILGVIAMWPPVCLLPSTTSIAQDPRRNRGPISAYSIGSCKSIISHGTLHQPHHQPINLHPMTSLRLRLLVAHLLVRI